MDDIDEVDPEVDGAPVEAVDDGSPSLAVTG